MATSPYGNLLNLRMHQTGLGGYGGFQQPMLPSNHPTANPLPVVHPISSMGGWGGVQPVGPQPGMPRAGYGGFGSPTLPGGAFPGPVGPQPGMPHAPTNPGGPMLPGGYPGPVGPQPVMPPIGSGGFGGYGAPIGVNGVRPMDISNLMMLQRMGMR